MATTKPLPLYYGFYQLIKYLYQIINNFPKQYKYTLGENIIDLAWQCLDLVFEANALPNKNKYSKILVLINLISQKQFVHLQISYIKTIGEMIGGWLSWAKEI